MPKNTKKIANKNKVKKNTPGATKREIPFADDGQLYGQIIKSLGDRRFEIKCVDGKTRLGKLRGKIRKRKKTWVIVNTWVIVALRDFQDDKVDIIEVFDEEEVRRLEIMGEISIGEKSEEINENITFEEEDGKETILIDDI